MHTIVMWSSTTGHYVTEVTQLDILLKRPGSIINITPNENDSQQVIRQLKVKRDT